MKLNTFNRIAPYYDRLAQFVFGDAIKKSQTKYLNQLPQGSKILVIGGGTGWWLKELQSMNPTCEVWFIEASSTMLERARKNASTNVIFINGTEDDIPPIQFDGIVTYYFLDLFTNLEMEIVIARLHACLNPNGIWLATDFVDRAWWHGKLLAIMYFFFKILGALQITRLHEWERNLSKVNLKCVQQTFFYKGFIRSNVYIKI